MTKIKNKKRYKLYNQGYNDQEIAEEVGISRQAIHQWRNKNDLSPNGQLSKKDKNKMLELYNQDKIDRVIAEEIDIFYWTVGVWRRKNNLSPNGHLSDIEKEKILELYQQGLNDNQIAEHIGITAGPVTNWRNRNNLEPNGIITDKEEEKMLELYKKGWVDKEIAELLGVTNTPVYEWRKRNNLKPNGGQEIISLSSKKHQKALELYKGNLSDKEIATELNVSTSSVWRWREKNNLKPNKHIYNVLSDKKHQERLKLYNKGWKDRIIAEEVGVSCSAINYWRNKNNLSTN